MIHDRGDFKPGLSVVASGQVDVGNCGLDGRYHLTATLRRGDTFGEFTLFADLPRTHHARAHGNTEVIQISGQAFADMLMQYPRFNDILMRTLALNDVNRMTDWLDENPFFTTGRRQTAARQDIKKNGVV